MRKHLVGNEVLRSRVLWATCGARDFTHRPKSTSRTLSEIALTRLSHESAKSAGDWAARGSMWAW